MNLVYWLFDETCSDHKIHGYVVGITNNLSRRLANHRYKRRKKFQVKILFEGSREECIELEKQLRPAPFIGWNIYEGGGDPPHGYGLDNNFYGKKHTEKSRLKMSRAAKKRKVASHTTPHTEETKLKMKAARIRNAKLCEKCNRKFALNLYNRWHGENCRV